MDELNWLLVLTFGIMGAIFGSFANVIIYRLPLKKSIVSPRSHCQKCLKMVPWYHNIPIVSWIVLRGRCSYCGSRFSFRYPLVELLMAILFAMVFYFYGLSAYTVEYLIAVFALVTVSFIDLDHFLLPDVFTLSGIVFGLIGSVLNPERHFWDAFLGILMGGGFLWLVAYLYWLVKNEEGMGGGDIKLLAWLGSLFGWKAIPFIIMFSSITGSIVGITLMMRQKGNLKTAIPFGPYIVVAALLYMFLDQDLGRWYFHFLFPSQ